MCLSRSIKDIRQDAIEEGWRLFKTYQQGGVGWGFTPVKGLMKRFPKVYGKRKWHDILKKLPPKEHSREIIDQSGTK